MSDLGRISGQMLKANLERLGIDLAFETDLLFLDVSNGKVGVRTDVAPRELTNNGTLHTTNLIVDSGLFTLGDFQLNGSTGVISNNGIPLDIISASGITNFNEALATNRIIFKNNFIGDVVSNESLILNPNGAGIVDLQADVDVTGDLHATGNVTLDGQITFGDNSTDTVTISSEINSDVTPDVSDTYDLGSQTKQWGQLHSRLLNGQLLQTTDFSVPGIDSIARRPGNTWYVSAVNGSDTNEGDHQLGPFRTVKHALGQAQPGDNIYIYDGEYEEEFPLTVPQGVSVRGEGIRSVKIYPHTATNDKDAFLLNGETTITDITVSDFYFNSTNNTGYAFRFANNYNSGARSPYIQNVTVLTKTDSAAESAGRGAFVDGSVAQSSSQEASMLFHSVTFITPGNIGLYMTNGVRVEWLNSFTYFASKGLYATNGSTGRSMPDGSTIRFGAELRSIGSANVYGTVGAEADGNSTLMYLINHNFAYIGSGLNSDNDPTLVDQQFEAVEANNGKIYYTSVDQEGDFRAGDAFIVDQQTGFVTINGLGQGPTGINQIVFSNGDNTTTVNPFLVSSGNIQIQGNELNTTGGDLNFAPSSNQTNLNDNVDILGSLDVGGDVTVNGIITFGDSSAGGGQFSVSFDAPINIDLEPKINKTYNIGSDQFSWKAFYTNAVTLDNIRIFDNRITTTESSSDLELRANGTGNVVFGQGTVDNDLTATDASLIDVDITGPLAVIGPVNVTGNINIDGDVSISGTLDLSSSLINIDNIIFDGNKITTTSSNSDLELQANGTGRIYIPNQEVNLGQALQVNTLETNTLNNTGTVTSDIFRTSSLTITNNTLTSDTNIDLELSAPNGDLVYVPNNNVTFGQDLTVSGTGNDGVVTSTFAGGEVYLQKVVAFSESYMGTAEPTSATWQAIQTFEPGDIGIFRNNDTGIEYEFTVIGWQDEPYRETLDIDAPTLPDTAGFWNNTVTIRPYKTYLRNSSVTGTITHTGAYNQTGNKSLTGFYDLNGSVDVNSAQFDNIKFDGNVVTTTQSNSDLELRASGTGVVNIQPSVTINNNLSVGVLDFSALTATNTVTSSEFYTDQILIKDNFITTTQSNSDLELRAPLSRIINFNDETVVENNLTVNSNTSLQSLNVITSSQVGNKTQLGDVLITGDVDVSENTSIDGKLKVSEIDFNTNVIATVNGNTDLEFRANGTGKVLLPTNDVEFGLDLFVPGGIVANDISISNVLTFDRISDTEIIIDDNFIKTSTSNANLEFSANGTGLVLINDSLQVAGTLFADNLIAPDATTTRLNVTTISQTGDRIQTGDFNHPGDNTFIFEVPTNSSGPYSYAWVNNYNWLFGADRYVKNITYNGDIVFSGLGGSGYGSWTAGTIVTGYDGFQYEIGTLQGTGGSTFGITESDPSNPDRYYTVKRLVTLDIAVSDNAQYQEILFAGNSISTTTGNTDLELRANGTGRVVFDTNDLIFKRNLEVIGNVDIGGDITVSRLVFNSITDGNILVDDNFISTTLSNSDLDLRANGAGIVNIPSNDVDIQNDLTVLGSTDIQSLSITNLNHTGNRSLPGDYNLTGLFNADNLSTRIVYLDNIEINNNTIRTTVSNSDLELRAVGTGVVETLKQTVIVGDLSVLQDISVTNIDASISVNADTFTTGDIVITDSSISTTQSNSDLNFIDSGPENYIRVEDINFGQRIVGGSLLPDRWIDASTINQTFSLAPAGNLVIYGTDALILPIGTTAQSNTTEGHIRYNTTTQRFEGRNAVGVKPLGGVFSKDTLTRVLANDNKTISFTVAGTQLATITETSVNLSALSVGNLTFDNNVISSINNNNINIIPNGTGDVILSDIIPRLSEFENTGTAPFTLACTASGYVKFNSSTAIVIPSGTDAERHATPETGEIRFNVEAGVPEVYDGTQWNTWAGQSQTATEQEIDDLSTIYGILLG